MKTNYKKILKLASLLMTSVLIGSVSASTYYSMFMTATVGVSGANKIFFTPGENWGSSTMGPGNQTVTLDLNAPNGTITTIGDPVRIYNSDQDNDHSINLKLISWDGESQSKLNYINITLYDAVTGGSAQGNTIYLTPGSGDVTETGPVTIGKGATWRVEWVIYWKPEASGTDSVTVQLELEVDKQ